MQRGEKKPIQVQLKAFPKDKNEKNISAISDTSFKANFQSKAAEPEEEPSVDSKIKSIRNKLANTGTLFDGSQDVEEWIKNREFEILKLENEINMMSPNMEEFSLKIKEISILKNEIKIIKDKLRRSKSSSRSTSAIHTRTPTPSISDNLSDTKLKTNQANLQHSKSLTQIQSKGLPELEPEPRIASTREGVTKKLSGKYDTPKFEQTFKPNRIHSARITPISEREENYTSEPDPSYRDAVSPKKVSFDEILPSYHSETSNKKSIDSVLASATSKGKGQREYFSSGKDEIRRKSPEDPPKESERLRAQKARQFDILDEDEELIVTGKLDDYKRDKLVKKYKSLYYKARELKQLLNEFADNNGDLKSTVDEHEREKKRLQGENQRLKEKIDGTTKKLMKTEDAYSKSQSALENKLFDVEQERNYLTQKLEELQRQNEFLSMRLTPSHQTVQTTRENPNQSERHAREIEELERTISQKDKTIKELEEIKVKDNYAINELKADLEMMKKRYLISQEEIKDLQTQNFEAQAKAESTTEIIYQLKDEINDLRIQVKTKSDQIDMDKRKIQDIKTKLRDLENENTTLKHENDKLVSELRSKEKLETKLTFSKEEVKILKENNMKLQEEIIRMSKASTTVEEQLSQKDFKIEELKKQITKHQDSEKKADKYIEKNKHLKNLRDELKESNETLKLELRKAEQKIKELEINSETYRTEKQKLLYDLSDVERRVNLYKLENEELKRELDVAIGKAHDLTNQVDETERAKETYKNKMILLKMERTKLKEEFEEKENKIKNDYKNEIKRLNQDNEKHKEAQSKLKIINDIQSIIKDHRKNRLNYDS